MQERIPNIQMQIKEKRIREHGIKALKNKKHQRYKNTKKKKKNEIV